MRGRLKARSRTGGAGGSIVVCLSASAILVIPLTAEHVPDVQDLERHSGNHKRKGRPEVPLDGRSSPRSPRKLLCCNVPEPADAVYER